MKLFLHQLRAEQLIFWRNRESAVFIFIFPIMLFVLLGVVLRRARSTAIPGRDVLLAGMIGYGAANTGFAGHGDHAGDPARVRDPEAAALDAAARRASTSPPSLGSTMIVFALQTVTLFVLGGFLYDTQSAGEHSRSVVLLVLLGAIAFTGLGLAIASLIRSAEGASAVVNVDPAADGVPLRRVRRAQLPGRARCARERAAALALHRPRPGRVRSTASGLERPRLPSRSSPPGARPATPSPSAASAGSRANVRDLQIGVIPLSMQDLASIAFLDDDGDIRVNFGMFAGRDATQAEIDELAHDLLAEVQAITIVSEQRTVADREMEASVHQIRIELDDEDPQRPLLIAERWAEACVAERHAEITEA